MPSPSKLATFLFSTVALFHGCGGKSDGGAAGDGAPPGSDALSCPKEYTFFYQPGVTRPGVDHGEATRLPLARYCEHHPDACPASPDAARTRPPKVRITGCGLVTLQWNVGDLAGMLWTYDSSTGVLLGAGRHDDVFTTLQGCADIAFQAGEGPPLPADAPPGMLTRVTNRRTCPDVLVESL
jgi:hypothetical protein